MQHTCFVSGGILYMISALYLLKKIVQFIVTNVYGSLCKKALMQYTCVVSAVKMYSFKNNVIHTLSHHNARPLQDIRKVSLGCAVLLALRRPLGR